MRTVSIYEKFDKSVVSFIKDQINQTKIITTRPLIGFPASPKHPYTGQNNNSSNSAQTTGDLIQHGRASYGPRFSVSLQGSTNNYLLFSNGRFVFDPYTNRALNPQPPCNTVQQMPVVKQRPPVPRFPRFLVCDGQFQEKPAIQKEESEDLTNSAYQCLYSMSRPTSPNLMLTDDFFGMLDTNSMDGEQEGLLDTYDDLDDSPRLLTESIPGTTNSVSITLSSPFFSEPMTDTGDDPADLAIESETMLVDLSPSPNSENQGGHTDPMFSQLKTAHFSLNPQLNPPSTTESEPSVGTRTKKSLQPMIHTYAVSVNGSDYLVVNDPARCMRQNPDSVKITYPRVSTTSREEKSSKEKEYACVLKQYHEDNKLVDDRNLSNRVGNDQLGHSVTPSAKQRTSGLIEVFGSISVKSKFIREVRREILRGSRVAGSRFPYAMLTMELQNIDADLAGFLTRLVVISGCQTALEAGQNTVLRFLIRYNKPDWKVFDEHLNRAPKRSSKTRKKSSAEHGTESTVKRAHECWIYPLHPQHDAGTAK